MHTMCLIYIIIVASTNGPRFFSKWKMLGVLGSSHVTSFYAHLKQYLIVTSFLHNNLSVYSIEKDNVKLLQTLSIQAATVAKPVYIEGHVYVAVACSYSNQHSNVNSRLYAWNNNRLILKQTFNTSINNDVDFTITVHREILLVFSSEYSNESYKSSTLIYKWNKNEKKFTLYQQLNETSGGQKVHFFYVKQQLWLTVACQFNDGSAPVYSYVYKFNGEYFNLFQSIPSYQTKDLYPMVAGHQVYLIAANFQKNGNHNTNSIVYRFDDFANEFKTFKMIKTRGAQAVEFFVIKNEYFIAIANSYDETSTSDSSKTTSAVYRFEGYNFEAFQEIPTTFAVSIHSMMNVYECWILAIANSAGDVVLYKLGNLASIAACAF